jgi:RimJ/RimL family protein N-acetyltransferase
MEPGPLPLPEPPLADALVALRAWRDDDAEPLAVAFRDPEIHRFSWPRTAPYTLADARRYLTECERDREAGRGLQLAVTAAHAGPALIGGVALYDVDREEDRGWLGYWVAPSARGRGVATHAARLLARWGFAQLGLARIELTCGPDNAASQAVAVRCGFVREGLLRAHMRFKDGRRDTVVFGLLPHELR